MNMKFYIIIVSVFASATAQQYTTPVPILKQINKHNEDGSYSYGYESADGTYKIESKYPNGEVFGKYGYKDDTGTLREIEYGATNHGFQPQGNGITVPPPTVNDNKEPLRALGPNEEDDGQYREDPSIYYKDDKYSQNSIAQPAYRKGYQQPQVYKQNTYQQPAYQQPTYQQPSYQQPAYQQQTTQQTSPNLNFEEFINSPLELPTQPKYRKEFQQPQYQPQYQQQYEAPQPQTTYFNPQPSYYNNPQPSYYNPAESQQLQGVPASNVNLDLGSYTINYK